MAIWPPTHYPLPFEGPFPRTDTTVEAIYHAEDHNDGITNTNTLVARGLVDDSCKTLTGASGNVTINLALARTFTVSIDSNVTGFTISNLDNDPSSTYWFLNSFNMFVVNHTGGLTVTWSFGGVPIIWPNQAPPSLSNATGTIHLLNFTYWNNGGTPNWVGLVVAEELG
jgi:hypothetical protein